MGRAIPLTTLLSWAWVAFAIEADNAVEAAATERVGRLFRVSLAMWTNGLRLIDDQGVSVDELRTRARAGCNIGGLERWGWISVGDPAARRRDGYGTHRGVTGGTVLRPTRAGVYARRVWPGTVAEIEERWRTRFGGEVIDSLGEALLPLAGPMPWSPPEVHASDGFLAHVVDGPTADDAGPVVALLGQALTALTLEHEREAKVSLPMGANVMRVLDAEPVRIRDLPQLSGVSKEAVEMAVNFLARKRLAALEPQRTVRLTPLGLEALDGYRTRAARPENAALRASLEAIVSQRDALVAGLVPPAACWRGEKPYLAHTGRLLADPTAALPWHPMVLHRGGWPDGA